MNKKIFFLIRDKLGDSLIAAQVVLAFRAQFPPYKITLMMRSDYAYFLKDEPGIRLLSYKNSVQAYWKACWIGLTEKFDALIVLRGFGKKIAHLGKLINADRKIHMRDNFPHVFPEYPPTAVSLQETFLLESVLRTVRVYKPELQCKARLFFPSLVAKRSPHPSFIGVCPITDEIRKNLTPYAVKGVIAMIQQQYPAVPIYILVRCDKEGEPFTALCDGVKIRLVAFKDTKRLLMLYQDMHQYYGADTGLYHLAAAMDIPATVFFGSTPSCKVVLPKQRTCSVRLASLGDILCAQTKCQHPVCLDQIVANLKAGSHILPLDKTPQACPLRTVPAKEKVYNRFTDGLRD